MLDFPEAVSHWQNYISVFDIEQPIPTFPTPTTEKEKRFLASRNIYTPYYNIKNLETQLANYTIYAPFSGVLIEAIVDKGTLIRPGQKLGAFINPNVYELEVAVNTNYADFLRIGKSVKLHNVARTKTWTGRVIRVNSTVNSNSQTIPTFIQVSGSGLKEGMYLEADISAKAVSNTYEVERKLLVENDKLYIVQDATLSLQTIQPVYFKDKTVVVKGLENGMQLVTKPVPNAYQGMIVQVFDNNHKRF